MDEEKEINGLLDRVKKMEKGGAFDLSSDEDLSIAIMNLISIEEHLFFSGEKTGDTQYFDLLFEVREMRKELLKRIIKDYEGEVWCVSKHLLSSSMRLLEVGTKMLSKGDKEASHEMFAKAYKLYSMFWGLNLGVVKAQDLNESEPKSIKLIDDKKGTLKGKASVFDKLGELVKKAVDCCRE